jgi:hypothetical protein
MAEDGEDMGSCWMTSCRCVGFGAIVGAAPRENATPILEICCPVA